MRCILSVLCFLLAVTTYADPRTWGQQGLPIRGEAPVYMGASASDPWGPTVIVWVDYETGSGDIYGQLLDVNGVPMWGDSGRLLVGGEYGEEVQGIHAADGVILIFYSRLVMDDWGYYDLWVQQFDFEGNPIWPQNEGRGVSVPGWEAGDVSLGGFRMLANGDVCVTYSLWDFWHESYTAYAHRISASGNYVWDNPVEIIPFNNFGYSFNVAFAEDGTMLVARGVRFDCDWYNFDLTKYLPEGTIAWGPRFISEENDSSSGIVAVVVDNANGCYAAWCADGVTGSPSLVIQRYDQNGDSLWSNGPVLIDSFWARGYDLNVISNEEDGDTSGVLLVWADGWLPSDSGRINAQKISSAGELVWGATPVQLCYNGVTGEPGRSIRVHSDRGGGLICFIQPGRWNGQLHHVPLFATRLNSEGNAVWGSPCGVMIDDGQDDPRNPVLSVDWNGTVALSWDEKFSQRELHTERIAIGDGQPLGEYVWGYGLQGSTSNIKSLPLPGGRAAVVWNDSREGNYTPNQTYFQFVGHEGGAQFEQHGRALRAGSETESYYAPDFTLCEDGAGGFFAAFDLNETRWDGSSQLRIVRITAAGERVRDPAGTVVVDELSGYVDFRSRCVQDGQAGVFVIWNQDAGSQSDHVYVKRYGEDLSSQWASSLQLTNGTSAGGIQDAVAMTDGSCVVLWGGTRKYVAKVTHSGMIAWSTMICDSADSYVVGNLALDSNDNTYAVWPDERDSHLAHRIYGQKLDSEGVPQLAFGGIQLSPGTEQATWPRLMINPENQLFLLWEAGDIISRDDIYAQKFSSLFEPQWASEGVPVAVTEFRDQQAQAVDDGMGGIFVAWAASDETSDIRGKHLNSQGEIANEYWGGDHGGVICDTIQSQYNVTVVRGWNAGEYFCFWKDSRTASQVFGQFIDEDSTDSIGPTPVVNELELAQNYPNPFNSETTFIFSLPRAGHATLKIYNLLGQETATVTEGMLSAGRHQLIFDASVLSSGVYIYRLTSGEQTSQRKLLLLK